MWMLAWPSLFLNYCEPTKENPIKMKLLALFVKNFVPYCYFCSELLWMFNKLLYEPLISIVFVYFSWNNCLLLQRLPISLPLPKRESSEDTKLIMKDIKLKSRSTWKENSILNKKSRDFYNLVNQAVKVRFTFIKTRQVNRYLPYSKAIVL